MTVKALFLIVLGGVLANNYALEKFLGLTPLLGFGQKNQKLTGLGLGVTAVMLVTAALAWPLERFVLAPLHAEYLQLLVYAALVLLAVYLGELALGQKLGVWFPVIALNSAVLGLAVNNAGADYNFLESLLAALGAGLGFWLALLLLAGVKSRVEEHYVPKAFRGLPIDLLAAAILSMALVAFK